MQIIAIGVLALVLGFVYTWIQPKIVAAIPASAQSNKIASTFIVGAVILIAVFASSFVLGLVGMKKAV